MTNPQPDYGITIPVIDKPITQSLSATDHSLKFLSSQIEDPNYTHELSAAQLWAIRTDGTFHLIAAHPDVYDLLDEEYNLRSYLGILIHTSGWAAPLGANGSVEGPPSQHALRRRVALATCVTDDSAGSALSFADDPEIVTDPGSATGSLASAMLAFWERNKIDL